VRKISRTSRLIRLTTTLQSPSGSNDFFAATQLSSRVNARNELPSTPRGNLTGVSIVAFEMAAKWLKRLLDLDPQGKIDSSIGI
jgi:hypothetical protein